MKPLSLNWTGAEVGKNRLGPEQTSHTGGHYKDRQRGQWYSPNEATVTQQDWEGGGSGGAGEVRQGPEQTSHTGGHYKDRQRIQWDSPNKATVTQQDWEAGRSD